KIFGKTSNKKSATLQWSSVLRNGGRSLKLILLGTVTLLLSTGTAFGVGETSSQVSRNLSSTQFPQVETEYSTDGILDSYPAYLKFVYEVGKDFDRNSSAKLVKLYESRKRRNPRQAALFLKGLRFELIEKVQLMGKDPRQISSSSPEFRRWIGKYLNEWVREADEHLFRSYSASKNELAKAE
ncbi:MAG: hypothetical protein ACKOA8_11855, partial [Deltaproteobacteria bacterium]